MSMGAYSRRSDRGFTLIELLVVILIIAILAAIAIPVFLAQRNKSYRAQVEAALKNAATAMESYSTETGGDFTAADGADSDNAGPTDPYTVVLVGNGYKKAETVHIVVDVVGGLYCITADHDSLPASDPWQIGTYNSNQGSPVPNNADAC
jgi:prepilin-type N-terminal cleavage/methylation domain-containing protein